MKEFDAIQTKDCVYLHQEYNNNLYYDGVLPEKTYNKNWVKVKQIPVKVERLSSQPNINYRYELIDKSMMSDKIKDILPDDVSYLDNDYNRVWADKYKHLSSLYERKYDTQPDIMVEQEFKITGIFEIDTVIKHGELNFAVQGTDYMHKGTTTLNSSSIKHQGIDSIIFPDLLLPSRPSKLSSVDTYKIIREHVKSNIDGRYAEVTSDYDFCFTVKKRIPLAEHEKYTVDVNNDLFSKRKRKSKYETRYRTHRHVTVFEMTNDKDNYGGYTPIAGFHGKNHTDLKKNIDSYLENLMELINEPLVDCKHCAGSGVVLDLASE